MKTKISILFFSTFFLIIGCKEKSENKDLEKNNKSHNHVSSENEGSCVNIADKSKYVSHQISVTGEIENKLTLDVSELKKWNQNKLENAEIICQVGKKNKESKSFKGVLLKDVLEKAKIIQKNHKDRNFYIVARATDDYKATFSCAEIFNNETGNHVYIMYEENGKPIMDDGEMILISNNDIKTGPRHVKWLKSIEIYRVN